MSSNRSNHSNQSNQSNPSTTVPLIQRKVFWDFIYISADCFFPCFFFWCSRLAHIYKNNTMELTLPTSTTIPTTPVDNIPQSVIGRLILPAHMPRDGGTNSNEDAESISVTEGGGVSNPGLEQKLNHINKNKLCGTRHTIGGFPSPSNFSMSKSSYQRNADLFHVTSSMAPALIVSSTRRHHSITLSRSNFNSRSNSPTSRTPNSSGSRGSYCFLFFDADKMRL